MTKDDRTAKLKLLLCELKLEQRRVDTDVSRLFAGNKTIDFARLKSLSGEKNGIAKKIRRVETAIDPNIIA